MDEAVALTTVLTKPILRVGFSENPTVHNGTVCLLSIYRTGDASIANDGIAIEGIP